MSETEQRTLIKLPFPGFYYSWYSDALDSEESQWAEYEADERQKEEGVPEHLRLTGNEICEILMNVTNYSACYEAVAKLYVDAFDSVISEALGFPLQLEYEGMRSPREYNFETDRVFAYIKRETVAKLYAMSIESDHRRLAAMAKARFTSRDGFISHYSNNLEEWLGKAVCDWDHNEIETLLLACMAIAGLNDSDGNPIRPRCAEHDWERNVFDLCTDCDGLSREWGAGVDWAKYEVAVAELREEKRLAWLESHPSEPEPPPRCGQTAELF